MWHAIICFAEGHEAFINALSTLSVAIFTCLLVLATIGLYRTGEKAAVAAHDAVDVARNALVAVQRAFVFVDEFETHVVENEFIVLPKWKNSGSTPTRRMANHVNWRMFDGEPPDDFQFPDLDSAGNVIASPGDGSQPMYIGPHATIYAEALRIPTQHIDIAGNGGGRLFVWGWTRYHDVFGASHITRFCNEIEIQKLPGEGGKKKAVAVFRIYRRHNCTDEECSNS